MIMRVWNFDHDNRSIRAGIVLQIVPLAEFVSADDVAISSSFDELSVLRTRAVDTQTRGLNHAMFRGPHA
jgi:hypothetical protein